MKISTIEAALGFRLKNFQERAIDFLMRGRDLVVSAPTGSGKTAVYLGASMAFDGVTVICYPLVSLIQDQARRFRSRGFDHVDFYGSVTGRKKRENLEALESGEVKICLTTPETLTGNDRLQDAIGRAGGCSCMVVDEAHVFGGWSNTFRPAYRRLGKVAKDLGAGRLLLCSATLTPEAAVDAAGVFGRYDFEIVSLPPVRENLEYLPCGLQDPGRQIAEFISGDDWPGSGICYFQTVYRLDNVARAVGDWLGEMPALYHGQLSGGKRKRAQREWTENVDGWVLATKAFGMGIDKQNVRHIVHAELPPSLIDYAQETGRAGRDGEPAWCWLNSADGGSSAEFLTMSSFPSIRDIRAVFDFLCKRCDGPGFYRMPSSAIARGLGWQGRGGQEKVRTCKGWLSGSGLVVGKKAAADYVIDVFAGAEGKASSREAEMIRAMRRAGRTENFGHGGWRIVARREQLASTCGAVYSTWQKKLRDFNKRGWINYQSPDSASQVKILRREFDFDAERLIRGRKRARDRLDEMRAFNSLAPEDRPGAIEAAIGLESDRVREDLARAADDARARRGLPKRTRWRKPETKKAEALIKRLAPESIPWLREVEPLGGGGVALFLVDERHGSEFGFFVVPEDSARDACKKGNPGYPVYSVGEINRMASLDEDTRWAIHRIMAEFDGQLVEVLDLAPNDQLVGRKR